MENIPEEFRRGQSDSLAAVASGTPKLFWQTRGRWGEYFTQLMHDRYGVNVEHISDITTEAESSYRGGYNEVTKNHIDEKFGEGTFAKVLEEIRAYRERYYQQYFEQENRESPNRER